MVGSLQPDIAQKVCDIIHNPPALDLYDSLRRKFILRASTSDQKRLHQLIAGEELGDRKFSQLFRKMEQLLGLQQLPLPIMKQLFFQRFPTTVQAILEPTEKTLDIRNLANLADKIMEVNPLPPPTSTLFTVVKGHAVATSAKSSELHQLRQTVSDLTATVQALNLRFPLSSHINNSPDRSHDR